MGLWSRLFSGQSSVPAEGDPSPVLPQALRDLLPTAGHIVAESTADGKWVAADEAGLYLLSDHLEQSVPWFAVERMSFVGKQRVLEIYWTNRQAQPVRLDLLSADPEEFMTKVKGYLEHSLVLARQRKVPGGYLQGSVRRDSEGELFVVISTSKPDLSVDTAIVDSFEQELAEIVGIPKD